MESVNPYRPRIVPNDPVPSPFAWVPTLPTISQTREAAINSIQQNFAALNAGTAALPYLPLAGGVTMAGLFSLFANAATAMQAVPLQQLQSYVAANNGVATFNTRTGAVTLTSADVSAALTYVAANAAGQAFTGNISAPAVTSRRSTRRRSPSPPAAHLLSTTTTGSRRSTPSTPRRRCRPSTTCRSAPSFA